MLRRTNVKAAFTLAEVLITLGIIGVVAAMTMPTLINSTQGAQYKTAYKKALSVMSQAVVMNIALEDYDLSQTVAGTNPTAASADDDEDATSAGGVQSIYDLFKNRMNVVKVAGTNDFQGTTDGATNTYKIISVGDSRDYTEFASNHVNDSGHEFPTLTASSAWPTNLTMLFYNDGITFIFDNTQGECVAATNTNGGDEYCFGFIDVNGQKAPNRVVQCDTGSTTGTEGDDNYSCVVSNPTDIYPIAMYDQSVVPASAAARAVLYAK
ncbi:type II secretion system protein [bacterium]|nr:type II secretion system protein [bacterium]